MRRDVNGQGLLTANRQAMAQPRGITSGKFVRFWQQLVLVHLLPE